MRRGSLGQEASDVRAEGLSNTSERAKRRSVALTQEERDRRRRQWAKNSHAPRLSEPGESTTFQVGADFDEMGF